jgi:hypothetical protein
MRERIKRSAYTTVSVTSGDTTRTSKVSKNGDDVIVVGVRVIHNPVRSAARGGFAGDFVGTADGVGVVWGRSAVPSDSL